MPTGLPFEPDGDLGRRIDDEPGLLTDRRDDRDPGIRGMLRVAGDQGRQVGLSFGVGAHSPPRELAAPAIADGSLQGPASRSASTTGRPSARASGPITWYWPTMLTGCLSVVR